jgi:hypothetical protein
MLSSRLTSLLFGKLGSSPLANGLIAIFDCMCLFLVQHLVKRKQRKTIKLWWHLCYWWVPWTTLWTNQKSIQTLKLHFICKTILFLCKARKNAIRRAYCWIVCLMLVDLCSACFSCSKTSAYKTKMALCWFSECFVNDMIDIFHSRQKNFSRRLSLLYSSRWAS